MALGGLDEIGKNLYVIRYQNEIIVIDSGIKFPNDELPGIDLIIPDYTYLVEHADLIRGVFITHGHEDHIGGIPYLMKQINIPVYAGKLALGLIKHRLEEHGLLRNAELHIIEEDDIVSFDQLSVHFFRTTHSIPDSFGVAVKTPYGQIVHTGDFKFDFTPVGTPANLTKMLEIGQEGVLCLLSDSTNSEIPGFSQSEKEVGNNIHDLFNHTDGRIIFATFASNIYRLHYAIEAAAATKRKVVVFGRSMEKAILLGRELGHIRAPKETFIEKSDMKKFPPSETVILCTGSQGEPMAALSRIGNGTHRDIQLQEDDTIIFSSSPIPGNNISVSRTIDKLFRRGANVIYHTLPGIHASGHGPQEDQKMMLTMLKPRYFMPIHGEYRMLKQHAHLAEDCGMHRDHIFIMDNGEVLSIDSEQAAISGEVPSGAVYIDGSGVGDIGKIVLRDRKKFAKDGLVVVTVSINMSTCQIVSGPAIVTRGFVFVRESEQLMKNSYVLVSEHLEKVLAERVTNWSDLKKEIKKVLEPFLYEQTGRKPFVLPLIMNVQT